MYRKRGPSTCPTLELQQKDACAKPSSASGGVGGFYGEQVKEGGEGWLVGWLVPRDIRIEYKHSQG